MGSLQQLAEDFFTCSLCLEKLKDSRTLPCLHTFCKGCLESYINKTRVEWNFKCPLCEWVVDGSVQEVPVSSVPQWLDTFVCNSFITTVSKIRNARASEKACDICRQEHVLVEACMWCMECLEMLCEDCHRVHKRSRASRGHKIVSVDDLQNEGMTKLLQPSSGQLMCSTHVDKQLTNVCVECKMAVCEMCIAQSHAKCKRLEKLETMSPNLRFDMQEARRRVDACREWAGTTSQTLTNQLASLTQSKDTAVEEINKLKGDMLALLLKREDQALQQIEAAYSRQRALLTNQKRALEISHAALGKTSQFLDNILLYGTDRDILRNFDIIVKHVNVLEKEQSMTNQKSPNTILKFTPEKKTADFLKNTAALGHIKLGKGSNRGITTQASTNTTVTPRAPKPVGKTDGAKTETPVTVDKRRKPLAVAHTPNPSVKAVASFTGRCNSDTMKTDIRGIVVLPDDTLVVMDVQFRNKRLKKFNFRGKFLSQLDPGETPYAMALLPDSDIVVTLPRIKQFTIVSAGGTLHVTGQIKTVKGYHSLASSPDGMIAAIASGSSSETPSIDVISFNGEMLHSIPLDKIRFPFPARDVVLTPRGQIYILFSGNETLVSMSYQGDILMTYSANGRHGFKRPISVECDELDNAYIADLDAHAVHIIGGEGQYKGQLVGRSEGVRHPLAMSKNEDGILGITQSNGDVKLFQMAQSVTSELAPA